MTTIASRRLQPETYHRITFLALTSLVVIIVTGAAVRLTGSGLGCPDWPTCANDRVVAPLEYHAMVEFVNRVFTGVVSVAVIAGVLGALLRAPRRRDLTWLSLSLVIGVAAQAILGGLTVHNELDPRFVMAHFLLSQLIVLFAVVLHHRAGQPHSTPRLVVHRHYLWMGWAILTMLAVVMLVGTMVTGSGPHGGDADVVRLAYQPREITKVHGLVVWILLALVLFTVWRLKAIAATSTLVKRGEILMLALVMQGALGYLQYSFGVPAAMVLVHVAGATACWIVAIRFVLAMHERWPVQDIDVYDGDAVPKMFPL